MAFYRIRLLCFGLFCVGVFLLLAFLHPYTRQRVFGPKIQGDPLCAWQEEFRQRFLGDDADRGIMKQVSDFLGIKRTPRGEFNLLAKSVSDDEARLILLGLVDDPDENVRSNAAADLGDVERGPWRKPRCLRVTWRDGWKQDSCSRKPVVDALARLTGDTSLMVQVTALQSLGWIGPDATDALPKLRVLGDDPNKLISALALEAMRLITNDNTQTRRIAREWLMTQGHRIEGVRILSWIASEDPEAFAELVSLCDTSDPETRHYTIRIMGNLGPEAVPTLMKVLQGDDPGNCNCATQALGRIGPEARDAVPALKKLAVSTYYPAYESAVNALSCIDPKAYPKK